MRKHLSFDEGFFDFDSEVSAGFFDVADDLVAFFQFCY